MIATNDRQQNERFDAFSRLEGLILRETDPDAWNASVLAEARGLCKRWCNLSKSDDRERIAVLVGMYRLSIRAKIYRAPKEYFFWLLTGWLHIEAHVGPAALLHDKRHLGPLWRRLEAIRKKHRWPKEDENGDPWRPEEHPDQVPDDYVAWMTEFERVADKMERAALRAVCEKHGVPEIAELKETAVAEFERRCKIGYDYAQSSREERG